MHRKILTVARKLEQASKAHAGQAKVLKSIVKNGKKKQKAGVRYVPKVRLGLDVRLIRTQVRMLIWLLLSTARILTTPRRQRAVNARADNGTAKTMAGTELGTYRN